MREILPGLSMSAAFWHIKLEQIMSTPEERFILDQNALTGAFADAIGRDTVGCDLSRNPACLDIVSSQAPDLSFQRASGAGRTLQYCLPTDRLGEFVRCKGNASVGWTRGPVSGLLFVNHVGHFTPDDPTIVDEVGSYTTVNLRGSYAFPWRGRIQPGVNDIFDKYPPLDLSDGDGAQPFYDRFFHDPMGSTWWRSCGQQFTGPALVAGLRRIGGPRS